MLKLAVPALEVEPARSTPVDASLSAGALFSSSPGALELTDEDGDWTSSWNTRAC